MQWALTSGWPMLLLPCHGSPVFIIWAFTKRRDVGRALPSEEEQCQAPDRGRSEGWDRVWCQAWSQPKLEHRYFVARSPLVGAKRATLGSEESNALPDERARRNQEPRIASSRDCAEPEVAEARNFREGDRAVEDAQSASFGAQLHRTRYRTRYWDRGHWHIMPGPKLPVNSAAWSEEQGRPSTDGDPSFLPPHEGWARKPQPSAGSSRPWGRAQTGRPEGRT